MCEARRLLRDHKKIKQAQNIHISICECQVNFLTIICGSFYAYSLKVLESIQS